MPADKETQRHIHSVQTATSRDGPLTSAEEAVLDRLLARRAEALPEALARKERERVERARVGKKRAKAMAREEKLAHELRTLQVNIDRMTDILGEDLSNTARRHVAGTMDRFYDLTAKFIQNGMPAPSRENVAAFAELAAAPFLRRENVTPLRQRPEAVEPKTRGSIGLSVDEMANDPKIIAAAILASGRKRRGEIE